ncbi:MAG: type II secretion system protein [Chlamydiales bacterium]|nr:type II secretion system protein [Chlamydiia bacterium]MCP5507967.1 type II secretion system protein [Chlamydiales bacterium]
MTSTFTTLRRSAITLVEMLIVLVILALAAGFIGINIAKAVREQRFKTEVAVIADQLRLAQDIMLIMDVGIHVKFAEDPNTGGIRYWLEAEAPLPKGWKQEVERAHANLQAIHFVSIKDELDYPITQGVIDIKFLSRGSVMSKGALRLSTSETADDRGALESFVCLPGYPQPIVISKKENSESCLNDAAEKDQRLTRYTYEEVIPYFTKTGGSDAQAE